MNKFFRLAARVVPLGLAAVASSGFAQTTVNGPYYATPSWDQTLPVASRFLVLSNFEGAAVLDRETGLTWWRNPGTTRQTYDTAQRACAVSTVGGRFGWRLPATSELTSLFDPAATTRPFLPSGHPFGSFPAVLNVIFWTSTPDIGTPSRIATVGYSQNVFWQTDSASGDNYVFCVRAPS